MGMNTIRSSFKKVSKFCFHGQGSAGDSIPAATAPFPDIRDRRWICRIIRAGCMATQRRWTNHASGMHSHMRAAHVPRLEKICPESALYSMLPLTHGTGGNVRDIHRVIGVSSG